LERADLGGRRFELTLFRADQSTQTLIVGTSRPLRDPHRLGRLFAERLNTLDPGFGIETLMLRTFAPESLVAGQTALAGQGLAADATTERNHDLADLIDRLSNRLGPARVVRFAPAASHMPERTFRTLPAGKAQTAPHWNKAGITPPRPLRLLRRPEPLDSIALMAEGEPGDPPATFNWRKRDRQVRCASGPERILPEWWQGDGAWNGQPRDYWRVQDETGEQFWLFREGSIRDGSPPRWFLHGVFT
jgi:protein ImuB